MTIVIHMKYATIVNNDSVCETWKTDWQGNTTKLIDIHNGPWYATMPNSTESATGFDKGYLLGWANFGFDSNTYLYIDNFKSSTLPLINALAPPNPPLLFSSN